MHTYQLAIYTALDIETEAVPFLVEGQVNPTIPKTSVQAQMNAAILAI
jgi:hypothetical protein